MKKVMVIFGGESLEHEVSIDSTKSLLKRIPSKKYEVIRMYIDKKGNWYEWNPKEDSKTFDINTLTLCTNILDKLKSVDVVFPMIHGCYGEDGRLQGFLELFHIPYVGCDSKTSMLCMDKEYMKLLAKEAGIPILPYGVLTLQNKKEITDFPVIVKPANGGSSIGIGIAHNPKELAKKYREAAQCDSKVIVEKWICARELEVGILTTKKKRIISTIGEIIKQDDFYSYQKKYVDSFDTSLEPSLPKDITRKIYDFVNRIIDIFRLQGFARIDFFYEEEINQIYFNEVNTIPGFTEISMYPKLFQQKGISYSKLVSTLIESI